MNTGTTVIILPDLSEKYPHLAGQMLTVVEYDEFPFNGGFVMVEHPTAWLYANELQEVR